MGIADEMMRLTEGIINAHDARAKGLGVLMANTRGGLQRFASDRKNMSKEQAGNLAAFVDDLTKTTGAMLKWFQAGHKEMSGEQAGSLAAFVKSLVKDVAAQLENYHADREKLSEELKESLSKTAKEIESHTKKSLKDFHDAHAGMADALKKSLTKYVSDIIVGPVRKLLGEYASEMEAARAAWQGMAASPTKLRNDEAAPDVEPKGAVAAAAGHIGEKGKKRGKKKNK